MEIAVWNQIRINCIFYHLVIYESKRFLHQSSKVYGFRIKKKTLICNHVIVFRKIMI